MITRRAVPFLMFVLASCGSDAVAPDPDPAGPEAIPVPEAAAAWIAGAAVPFDGVSLDLPHDDLEILRTLVGDARIVSLGENTHGTRDFFLMKARILRFLVEEMVVFGFSHASGEFTAVEKRRASYRGRRTLSLGRPISGSFEGYMDSVEHDRFFLDLRGVPTASDSTAWLASELPTRHIGYCYDPLRAQEYWAPLVLPSSFDVMIHFRATSFTRVLPYEPPDSF